MQVFLVTGLNRQFGISDEWFAIGDSLVLTVLGQVYFLFSKLHSSSIAAFFVFHQWFGYLTSWLLGT